MSNPERILRQFPHAGEITIRPAVFFNQLFHYSEAHLVIRASGFALCLHTQFGIFSDCQFRSGDWLHDPVCGIKVNPAAIAKICYLRQPDSPPSFEIEFEGSGFLLGIIPSPCRGNLEITRQILDTCGLVESRLSTLQSRGAGAWLDEMISREQFIEWKCDLATNSSESGGTEITIDSSSLSACCRLETSVVDRDRRIWKFSDTRGESAFYCDTDCSGIVIPESIRNQYASLSRHTPPLV